MHGRVLANAGIFALGIILIIGGGWAIWHGSGYIQLEWGWTSVIAGAIAATGGVLTIAVGFVLQRLDAMHGVLLRAVAHPDAVAMPAEALAAAEGPTKETGNEPMPLGIETATPIARAPEPQGAAYADPGFQAAAAINLELLAHEERPVAKHAQTQETPQGEITTTAASEPPPEVLHAADQGPADDMVKRAGVSDEPELDAAIEELLAEGRDGSPQAAPALDLPPVSREPVAESPEPAAAPDREERGKPPRRAAGWRGLFSRKDRRAATPPPADQPAGEAAWDLQEQPAPSEPEQTALAGDVPAPRPAVSADTIPRTGDDWFDRALSGLDEVAEPYQRSERSTAPEPSQHEELARSDLEIPPPDREEELAGGAPPSGPAVIGRYTSGNTTYVMFADGSIEAETPNGVLHFASLADLKVYVEGQ